ncbi:UNVERIFIED_CONTAM: hypothetical protein H355_009702 [Colinus virginianus]|nr:hypothetical protein H355_009702 [Colinus virginianus]
MTLLFRKTVGGVVTTVSAALTGLGSPQEQPPPTVSSHPPTSPVLADPVETDLHGAADCSAAYTENTGFKYAKMKLGGNNISNRGVFTILLCTIVDGFHIRRGAHVTTLFFNAGHLERNPGAAVSTGTTIVAVTFKNGVVLGADTRTSAGSYVVNRAARKITPVHEKICVCRSGSAADTQAVTQIVKLYLQQYAQELPRRSTAAERRKHEQRVATAAAKQRRQQEEEDEKRKSEEAGEQGQKKEEQQQQKEKRRETAQEEEEGERRRDPPAGMTKKSREEEKKKKHGERRGEEKEEEEMSEEEKRFLWEDARAEPRVRAAATLFQSLCYEYKDILTAGLIVAGYDAVEGSQIYSIPLGGALMPMKCTAGGSGSSFISALMDAYFHPDMDKETAVDFVKRCVAHAISRDGSSGGMVRIIVVTKHGREEECVEGNRLPVNP